ncbi:hypothetical protein ACPA0F_18440 [Solibacillus silvestris]
MLVVTFMQCHTLEPVYVHKIRNMSYEKVFSILDEYADNLSLVCGKEIMYKLEHVKELKPLN